MQQFVKMQNEYKFYKQNSLNVLPFTSLKTNDQAKTSKFHFRYFVVTEIIDNKNDQRMKQKVFFSKTNNNEYTYLKHDPYI